MLDVIARAKVENTRSLEHVPVIVGVVGFVGLGEALGKCEDYNDNAWDQLEEHSTQLDPTRPRYHAGDVRDGCSVQLQLGHN